MSESHDFTCALCGGVFQKSWSDKEAVEECRRNFGVTPEEEECAVVCDDCYARFMEQAQRRGLTEGL